MGNGECGHISDKKLPATCRKNFQAHGTNEVACLEEDVLDPGAEHLAARGPVHVLPHQLVKEPP